jgi:heptosyltransferase-2
MELFTTAHDEELADRIWSTTGLDTLRTVYCLNPGAAYGSAKLWPAEHFAALARRLADDSSAGVMVLCGPSERALATQIVALADCERVHSLADAQVSIGLTKACIRRSSLVVSTDSGPRHIAAAFQRPVVALFGPTHQAWTDTFYDREIRLQRQVECGPCQLRHCPLDHRCMKELRVDEVLAAVQMLERTDTFSQRSGDYCAA